VLQILGSDFGGLSKAEIECRLAQFGLNELQKKKRTSPSVMLRQFTSFLVLLLVAAAAVSLILGDQIEAIVIMAIVVLAGVLGFI
jgi:Ca2+-transporting ATPase